MRRITITINGKHIAAQVAPRINLADFLREQLNLTGTHIGCEHGVCGACTVLIDGVPARSCITYAVALDGAAVTTIEGLDDDPVAGQLRSSFSAEHALQCGYCTPGMMISARDIVLRLPGADEQRIRKELSGNLCRCTGYVGIVNAVAEIAKANKAQADGQRDRLGPVGAHVPSVQPETGTTPVKARDKTTQAKTTAAAVGSLANEDWDAVRQQGTSLNQNFEVPFPVQEVWQFFDRLDEVAACIPGARLVDRPASGPATGEIVVKLGPISAVFAGLVEVERDDNSHIGVVRGAGRDEKSASRARGIIEYSLNSTDDGTRVDVAVKFLLAGALAQFSRSGLVKDIADQMTRTFAANLAARLRGETPAKQAEALSAMGLAWAAIRRRMAHWLRVSTGRSSN
jgi:carbon-monoxide dehydrogenase small subunit